MNGKLNWQYAMLLVVFAYFSVFFGGTAHAMLACDEATGTTPILPEGFKNQYCSHYRAKVVSVNGASALFGLSICAGGSLDHLGARTVTMLKYESVDMKDEPILQTHQLTFKSETANYSTWTSEDGILTVRLLRQRGYRVSQLFRSGHEFKGQKFSFVDAQGKPLDSAENASSGLTSHSPLQAMMGDSKQVKAIEAVLRKYLSRLRILSGAPHWFQAPKLETPRDSAQALEQIARKLLDQPDLEFDRRRELIKIINDLALLQAPASFIRE